MRSITVQPEQLESCVARMDDKNQDYLNGTIELFNAVDMMGNAWKGKDNQTFTTQISRFQSDFRQLSMLCTQYSEFLKNSARAYRQTQEQLISQANKLAQ